MGIELREDCTAKLDEDILDIGQFRVNVGLVSKDDIKKMRTYFPMDAYRKLKNVKSARMMRDKRRNQKETVLSQM